jgi:hypothetical protein
MVLAGGPAALWMQYGGGSAFSRSLGVLCGCRRWLLAPHFFAHMYPLLLPCPKMPLLRKNLSQSFIIKLALAEL